MLLWKLNELCDSASLKEVAVTFPDTLLKAHNFQCILRDDYHKLIVCPKCYTTFDYNDCLSKNMENIKSCTFVRFPRHPQARMRIPCGNALLKTVKTAS